MLNYKNLYFAVELDIADVLTTVGVEVKVGTRVVAWAHDVSAFGQEPEGLDCTPLASLVQMQKSGTVGQEQWTINFYYNDEDYQALKALVNGASQDIEVKMNNGATFTNKGIVSAVYVSDMGVNAMADATCVINLSNPDGWTLTPATP